MVPLGLFADRTFCAANLMTLVVHAALGERIGPRVPMTFGPVVMAAGALWLLRVGPDVTRWRDVAPGEDCRDPARFDTAYGSAVLACAGLLVAGGLVSWFTIPHHVQTPTA